MRAMLISTIILAAFCSFATRSGAALAIERVEPRVESFPNARFLDDYDNFSPNSRQNQLLHRRELNGPDRNVELYKSDLEQPKIVSTRPNYTEDGRLLPKHSYSGKSRGKPVDEDFVPERVYTQVRRTDTVKHLPRAAALANAATYEEIVNAPRLREILSHKKIQQVYEEEGYEDSGYDHGGYNHQGVQFESNKKADEIDSKKRSTDSDSDSTGVVQVVVGDQSTAASQDRGIRWNRYHSESQARRIAFDEEDDSRGADALDEVTEPYNRTTEETTATPVSFASKSLEKLENNPSSTSTTVEKSEESEEPGMSIGRHQSSDDILVAAESHTYNDMVEEPSGRSLEARVVNDPRPKGSGSVTFPGRHTRRQYAIGRPMDVYVQESVGLGIRRPLYTVPTNVHHYMPFMPPFPSFYSDNPGAHTAPLVSQRIPSVQPLASSLLPPPTTPADSEPLKFLSAAGTLNAYANLLQEAAALSNRPGVTAENNQNYADAIQPRFNETIDIDLFTPPEQQGNRSMPGRRPTKSRYNPSTNQRGKLYNNFTRSGSNYSGDGRPNNKNVSEFKNPSLHTRHPSLPRDSSEQLSDSSRDHSTQILAVNHGLARPPSRRQDPVKYIEQLTVAHYHNSGSVPISPPSVQNERLKELARQLNAHSKDYSGKVRKSSAKRRKRDLAYDSEKYPYFSPSVGVNKHSALRYASNPKHVPRKSPGGMEFYESRDKIVKCEEPQPPKDIIPETERDDEWNKKPVPDDLPRIKGIGDSIACLKNKYFGRNPLDNPFFQEKISEPAMYDYPKIIKHARKIRSPREKNERLMIVPSRNDSSNYAALRHQNYTNSEQIREQQGSKKYGEFPYKNHKPADAVVSPSVHQLRANSPYRYYSQQDDSYFPVRESDDSGQDNEGDDTKRHKYYLHKTKHKAVYKKKRVRPPYHYPHHGIRRPFPFSIYSIIGASNQQPVYLRPVPYPAVNSYNNNMGLSPGHHLAPPKHSDNYGSDSNNLPNTVVTRQPPAPTRWYIVRPGEYTENKDIASDSKPSSSSFWNYINPLRWWFPSYFDQRRGEPKYRQRRSSEQELFNRILAKTNLSAVEARVFASYTTSPPDSQRSPQTTTSSPISIQEFKSRLNLSSNRPQKPQASKLSRLTGGFISRNNFSGTTPSHTYSLNTPGYGGNNHLRFETESTTPMNALPTTNATKQGKPKVSFPRTKTPSKRKPLPTKKKPKSDIKSVLTSTTTSTTTTPSTTTRMYKPKRVVNKKKFDRRVPVDTFTVLRKNKQPTTTQFDSVETTGSSESKEAEEEPRRLQQVEHRRVTKEEVYKTSYVPEESRGEHVNNEGSIEKYSISSSEASPPFHHSESTTMSAMSQEGSRGDQDHTLTYMVNPVTGVGSWGEQPRRTTWKPKKRYPKRHLDSSIGLEYRQPVLYSYPSLTLSDDSIEQKSTTSMYNEELHSGELRLNNGDYVAKLLGLVSPGGEEESNRKSHRSAEKTRDFSPDSQSSYDGSRTDDEKSKSEEDRTPPIKTSPKFIEDPGKRKYFYVKT